jgi:DNA-directed RNA polymerase specialized sigma24 family protein
VDSQQFDELVGIMSRLADGDEAAVVTLYEQFGDRVAGTVRAVLRSRGLRLVHDEVGGLVFDACLAIAAVAGAWSPEGGALPWTWARRRVERCVDRLLGQRTVPLDEHLHLVESQAGGGYAGYAGYPAYAGAGGHGGYSGYTGYAGQSGYRGQGEYAGQGGYAGLDGGGARPLCRALAGLSATDDRCRLLDDAFDRAAVSPLDREVCLQYAAEQHTGNRSPATTVGAMFSLKEPTVRQRVRRSRERLRRLAAADTRFAPLAQLPLLACA